MERAGVFYVWVLPVLWAGCAVAQYRFPGDENAFAAVSSIPALWAALFLLAARVPKESIPVLVVLAGVPVMAGIGWVMDRVRVRKIPWAGLYLVTGLAVLYVVLRSFPSREKAISKNGSLGAYILLSANLGLYLSVPLSVVLTCIGRLWRRSVDTHSA